VVLESEHFKCISPYNPMYNETPPSRAFFSADFTFLPANFTNHVSRMLHMKFINCIICS